MGDVVSVSDGEGYVASDAGMPFGLVAESECEVKHHIRLQPETRWSLRTIFALTVGYLLNPRLETVAERGAQTGFEEI